MEQYEDITETGYNNWSDLQSLNDEYQGIQSYLDENPPKKKSGLTDKQRQQLIAQQQEIGRQQDLLEMGIQPYQGFQDLGRYNPQVFDLEDQSIVSPVANTETPFGTSRYDKHANDLYDLEHIQDIRAENQSGFNKLMSGTGKAVVLAGTTYLDGTVGLLYGVGAMTAQWARDTINGDMSWDNFKAGLAKTFNNEISNGLREVNQEVERILPNYSSEAENSRAWYQNMGTANFWADFLKQIGFTVGAYYSGASWTKALKAVGALSSAMGARTVGSFMSAVNEGRVEANQNSDDWKRLELKKFNYEFQKGTDAVMNDYYNGKLSDAEANSKLEQLYRNKEVYEQTINSRADQVGLTDLALNVPLLAVNDFFMYGKAYSRGFNNANKNQLGKRTFKQVVKQAGEELGIMENDLAKNATKQGGKYIWEPITTAKAAGRGALGFVREGHEEVAQAFASEFSKNLFTPDSPDAYLEALYDPTAIDNTKDFYRSMAEGFANTYGNIDTYQEFFMGGLNGLLGTPTFGRSQNRSSQTYIGKGKPVGLTGGLMGNIREARVLNQQGQEAVDFMNQYIDKYDQKLQDGLRHFAASDHFTSLMNGWAEESNAFEYKNNQDNDDFEAIVRFNSVGKLDDFKQIVNQDFENISDEELDKIAKYTTTNQQWKNPDGTYMSETKEGREKMREILTQNKVKLMKEVEDFEKAYETMTNITNDDLEQDKILELSWLKWKLDRFNDRYKSIKEDNRVFFDSIRNSTQQIIDSTDESDTGKRYAKAAQNVKDLIEYIQNSKTPLEMSKKLGVNSKALENLQDKDVYDFFAGESTLTFDEYKQTVQNLMDAAKMGKLAEQFDSRLKEYLEKPSKMQEAREKVQKKFDDRQKKKKAESTAEKIVDADVSDLAKNIEEYDFIEQDGDVFTRDGVNVTGNLDDESKSKVKDKFGQAKEVKDTKDLIIDMIDKDDLDFLEYDIDASDKEAVQQMLQQKFDEGDIDMFDADYNGDLTEYTFINQEEAASAQNTQELQEKDGKRRLYIMSMLAKTQKQKRDSDAQKENTPDVDTEKELENQKTEEDNTTGHDGVEKVNPVETVVEEKEVKAEESISSADINDATIDVQQREYDDNIDIPTAETSQWRSGISLLPLSRFRKQYGISEFDYAPLYKIVQEDPEGIYFTGPNETEYVENVGEYLDVHGAYENRHKSFAKVGSKVTFAVSKTLNDKVTQPVILIMDETGQNVLGNLPLLNAKGNSEQLNDFISYCIDRIDQDATDDVQIIRNDNGEPLVSQIDQNYIGRIPFIQSKNAVIDVFPQGAKFALAKEDGEVVGVYTKKSDFPDQNVRAPKRALKGQPFVLIKSSAGMEVTVPIFMNRYNFETSKINGNPTYFDQEVRKTVESIVNRNNQKRVDTQISLDAMNKLNSLFSSQDFHVNFDSDTGMITNIYVGGKDASVTETTRRYLYHSDEGVLDVDNLMNKIYQLNMPINVDLNKINTNAKLGGVGYNTAIAQMAQVSLAPNTKHTVDDWFTIKPVVDGKMVNTKTDRYGSKEQIQSSKTTLQNGDMIDRQTWEYENVSDGTVFSIDSDVDSYTKNHDADSEKRLLDRARLYTQQRLMQDQDAVIHLNFGQILPLDYDIKNDKLIIPEESKVAQETDAVIQTQVDLPASQVLQTQGEVVVEPNTVQHEVGKIDYESADMNDIETWYEEDCDVDGYNDVWNQSDDETKKKIYAIRDLPNLVDVFMELSNGSDRLLNSLIDNTPLTRRVDDAMKTTEQVKQEELDWLKKIYPQLSSQERLRIVDGLIKINSLDNPGYAWGMFSNGIIYLSDKAADGTIYHEAFHAVAHTLMSSNEYSRMLNVARTMNPGKTDIELEEMLAEDFRGYMQIEVSDYNDNFLQRLFKQLRNIIRGLFDKQYVLNNIYYRISQGLYRDRNQRESDVTRANQTSNTFTQEMQDIKSKAIADGTFMKAPNGNPTNLNERQWLQVRTNAFKKWFGDWDIAQLVRQAKNAWNDPNSKSKFVFSPSNRLANAYQSILGHEIKSIILTDDAIRHIKKNHSENEELRGQVNLTPEDIAIIPYVLNNFDSIERSPEQDDKMGNRAVEIRKRINGISVVATIEKGKDKEFVVTNWQFVKSNALDAADATPGPNVRNDFDAAKIRQEIDKIKYSLENSSKVVDENGEPLVVYHGSDNPNLTTFDNTRNVWFGSKIAHEYYITYPSQRNAELKPIFINIRKPATDITTKFDYDINVRKLQSTRNDGVLPKAFAEGKVTKSDINSLQGFALFSNQIKSAADNNGEFSTENDNIYYRMDVTFDKFLDQSLKNVKDSINGMGSVKIGSETVVHLITGKNKFHNNKTGKDDVFDKPRQFVNLALQYHADYNSESNYDTTGLQTRKNNEKVLQVVNDRISSLGLDGYAFVVRNEYGAYELKLNEEAFGRVFNSNQFDVFIGDKASKGFSRGQLDIMNGIETKFNDQQLSSRVYYNDIAEQRHRSLMYENLSEDKIEYLNRNNIYENVYENLDDETKEQLFVCMS